MEERRRRIYNRIMIGMLSFVLAAGLALPLQTETSSAASSYPKFSNKSNISAKLKPVKKKRLYLNLRLEANQPIGRTDTVQGMCYGGGYLYYLLNDRVRDRCRVVKMRRSNLTVVKMSAPLYLNHGNDMTYNTRTGKLVISNSKPNGQRLTVVNRNTLAIERRVDIDDLPEDLPGIDWERVEDKGGYQGFSNVAYNEKHDQYVVQLYKTRDFLFLDKSFRPVRYVTPEKWDKQMYQGIDSFGNRIVVANSFKSGKPYNVLSVYDWDGNYLSRVNLGRGFELETVYHAGSSLYAAVYKSYWAHYQWKLKTKKVKKKVKVKVRVKGKNGKYKYVTKYKKKKVKVKVYGKKRSLFTKFLNRDSNVYLITKL